MKAWGTFLMATGLLLSSATQAATQTTVVTQGHPVILPGNNVATQGTVSGTQGAINTQGVANAQGTTNTDVVVPVPPQVVWGNGGNAGGNVQRETQVNCMSCCIYQNRSYSEGSVVRAEGVLLQCQRDKGNLGTNNLVWRILKDQQ
ncbi:hypothetical protein DZS_18730 [Dickeya ananatis]|uniref:DUF1496 domain-containing protein n=1 Tax=Dickeya oryzae TaxID=1240404 RepID=A0ABS5BHH8_9GAMM|nr:DUF1496 domain-containing protein [Dickeya oryzae]AUQ25447.1 DUF1496 domain-containing protein [Dickeya zeae]MBP2845465.1 DUF1496 domain-containing protein [Dickeya oryzae]MBP2849667.1 DUF1496 domain-containing protein [Dickeya oryzae]MBP2859502.1 DUF1496 domain-containing protein [Dickeya oryzae]QIZ47099.1 DUF1496 domain-containing protein [Dickeya zeae]